MAITLNINCGCGAQLKSLAEAQRHADETHHKLTVVGKIDPQPKAEGHDVAGERLLSSVR